MGLRQYGIYFPVATAGDIKASGAAFPVIGFILLLLRAAAYRMARHKLGLADLFAWISWLSLLAMGATFLWSADHGGLGHGQPGPGASKTLNEDNYRFQVTQYVVYIFMSVTLGTTKLSILFFFRRMFAVNHRRGWDIFTRILITIVAIWTLAYTLTNILECGTHVAVQWNGGIPAINKYCIPLWVDDHVVDNSTAISDFILDVACVALPFPLLWRSNLQRKLKISIGVCFLFGFATIAISAARLACWLQLDDSPIDIPLKDDNLIVAISLQWAMIEAGIAFIASQLPALGIYVTKFTNDHRARENHALPGGNGVVISLQALPSKAEHESDAEGDDGSNRVEEGRASTQGETDERL